MFARRLNCRSPNISKLILQHCFNGLGRQDPYRLYSCFSTSCFYHFPIKGNRLKFSIASSYSLLPANRKRICESCCACSRCYTLRYFSTEGDGHNASEDKHVSVRDTTAHGKVNATTDKVVEGHMNLDEHARLGEEDQQEWLMNERLAIDSKRNESPFLTKRERFKNEFLRRVVPWDKISVSWKSFPYYVDTHTKRLLVECVAAHMKQNKFASSYGSRLRSSSGRILLQSTSGTEMYRERLVKALARDLRVPLLILDSSVLAPYDFGQDYDVESEVEDENAGLEEECTSESELEDQNDASNEDEWSTNEAKSEDSDVEEVDIQASTEALKKLVHPCTLEEFAKRVSGESEDTSDSVQPDASDPSKQPERPLRKGDRVKYVGASVHVKADNRIILGKIPTSGGSTNAYTIISCRPLTNGQRGEVYEINGNQVAIILDSSENEACEGNKDAKTEGQATKPSIYWTDIQDIVYDPDTEAEDWYLALEALCEILPTVQPIIIYFPDSSEWLSRAVPKSSRKEFIQKVETMFEQLSGPVVLICGQNKLGTGTKGKEKYTMVLPQLGRIGRMPIPLQRLTEGLQVNKSSKGDGVDKLFTNAVHIHPPKEKDVLKTFNKQIEDDRRIIVTRNNLIELHKVLEEHELSCMELLGVKTDGVILTERKAEKVVGWARNHYLSSTILPSIKSDKLIIPSESLETAIERLREMETFSSKPSQSLKSLAKDEYESNFISAVVPRDEIGVTFDDIGALEDVKQTLNELVTLPMRRPELFSHGNLLKPCKGLLLFGPPGTGKTLLAKALATEAGANFISITGSTLTSKWFGDAEKLTKALFSFANRLAPVIIFVDEIDSLLGARGGAFEHEATRRMRNEFMAAWDGLRTKDSQRILVLGATNRPFDLDDAVIRRLPRRIYVDLPDAVNRKKILSIFLSNENLHPSFKCNDLANSTEGYSGSDLKNLCVAAAYRPVQELLEEEKKHGITTTPMLRPLTLDDFIEAKSKVGASVAYDATSMNELRKWNDLYGEGGSRKRSQFGFGN